MHIRMQISHLCHENIQFRRIILLDTTLSSSDLKLVLLHPLSSFYLLLYMAFYRADKDVIRRESSKNVFNRGRVT